MAGIQHFLRKTVRDKLAVITNKKVLCFGNEAADADSIVGALCYSYFLHKTDDDASNSLHLPVTCIPRNDLRLRRDVDILLAKTGIQLDDLICLDDIAEKILPDVKGNLVLYDHNALSIKASNLVPNFKVEEIIDHHIDLEQYPECTGTKRNIAYNSEASVAEVGSACTLIFEKFIEKSVEITEDVATLLMGVITLDTLNMDENVKRGTDRDAAALIRLQSLTRVPRDTLFEELKNAKIDRSFWNSLSAEDCLRLDYKLFNLISKKSGKEFNIGISSVLLPLQDFLSSKSDLLSASLDYLRTLNVLIIMTFIPSPEPQRGLIIISKKGEELNHLSKFLSSYGETSEGFLQLKEVELNSTMKMIFKEKGLSIVAFDQGFLKASRKQVAPIVSQFYETL